MGVNDSDITTAQVGRVASVLSAELKDLILEREEVILKNLIGKYRDGNISHEELIGGVAEIAGLRNLLSSLKSKIRLGQEASDKLSGGS